MRYRTINESVASQNWSSTITESTGVTDPEKIKWMSNFLQIQESVHALENAGLVNESFGVQGPEAVPGMGAVKWPGVGQANGDILAPSYSKGSGDTFSKQMAFAMNIAAYTVGLETLPVIPMEFPSLMFGYLDNVYSGNFDQTQAEQGESDIFIELSGAAAGFATGSYANLKKGDKVVLGQIPTVGTTALAGKTINNALYGTFLGTHRISGNPIIKFEGGVTLTGAGATAAIRTYGISAASDIAPSTALKINAPAGWSWGLIKGAAGGTSEQVVAANDTVSIPTQFVSGDTLAVSGDLVSAVDMHIPEFSKPGNASYNGTEDYKGTRKQGEAGTQNIVSLRVFSTSVEAGEVSVLGEITRTQIKDLASYGQDGVGQLYKAAQNELTQTMNADILRTEFRLGVTAASKLRNKGVDLNLFIGDPATSATKALSAFGIKEFVDVNGVNRITEFAAVKNAESNSSAENNFTRSRRIVTRILAASNIISTLGRHGAGDFCVMNTQLATAIQDIKGFIINPFDNTVTLDKKNLYNIGTIQGGIKIFVDPLMDWNDNRILVGCKGDEMTPGLKLFIYTLGESVETISEKAMAPKLLVSSRYALVPVGFHPEVQYLTFAVANDFGLI